MVNYIERNVNMGNANDTKILELKAQIKEKKNKLKKLKKFVPITNCSIEVDTVRYNLQVLNKEQLITLLVKLNSIRLSVVDLELEEYFISGYKIEDWISDIKSRLEILSLKEEENKLLVLENKLHTLLSTDKKVELEIDSIESMLK
jgi:hypothetical protein